MADSLFDQEDTNTDYLQELTGPGAKYDRSKYATEAEMYQAIAKGKVLADKTVSMQNLRFDELREDFLTERSENTAKDSFDELRKTLLERKPQEPDDTKKPDEKPSLSLDEVKNFLVSEKQKEKEEQNIKQAETLLRQRFGEDARKVFREKMNTLELSDEDVKFLARKSPLALLNALGLQQQQDEEFEVPPRSSLRSDTFKPQVEIRDAVYYEKLRRENPKEYFSEKISVQRLKDMDDPEFLTRINQRDRRRTNF